MIIAGHEVDESRIAYMGQSASLYANLVQIDYKRSYSREAVRLAEVYASELLGGKKLETDSDYELSHGIYRAIMNECGF